MFLSHICQNQGQHSSNRKAILDCDLVLLENRSGVFVEKGIFKALDLQLGMMMMYLVHGQLCALPPLRGSHPPV